MCLLNNFELTVQTIWKDNNTRDEWVAAKNRILGIQLYICTEDSELSKDCDFLLHIIRHHIYHLNFGLLK